MKRFIEGIGRGQSTFLPERLDDYIAESNPVGVVDTFFEALDLRDLDLEGVDPCTTANPAYRASFLRLRISAQTMARRSAASVETVIKSTQKTG